MSKKVLLPQLVGLISSATGKSKTNVEIFLKSFFNILTQCLEEGDSVKVKGIGTFKLNPVEMRKSVNVATGEEMVIPAHNKVAFLPAKTLAEQINREFAWLEIAEISDTVSNEELGLISFDYNHAQERVSTVSYPSKPNEQELKEGEISQPVSTKDDISREEEQESEHLGEEMEKEFGEIEPVEPFGPIDPQDPEPGQPIPEEKINGQRVQADEIERLATNFATLNTSLSKNEERNKKRSFNYFIITLLTCAALITGGFFLVYALLANKIERESNRSITAQTEVSEKLAQEQEEENNSPEQQMETQIQEVELTEENPDAKAPTAPSDEKITDTVTKTRYLTTIAKEHYGNYNLWPYIYIENQNKLGHPDRIKPGTKVTVPSLAKYGVDPNNIDDIEKAKKMGVDIYKKYR